MLNRTLLSATLLLGVACAESAANDTEVVTTAVAAVTTGEPAAATSAPANTAAPTSRGAVTGTVSFRGTAAPRTKVDLSADDFCVHHNGEAGLEETSAVRTEGGGLADVFIQLTDGVPDKKYDAPDAPVILDQVGCTYAPHVFGVLKKQDIEIRNSDETLHNIHPTPDKNKEFNLAMPNKGDVRTKDFRKAEDAIPFKCDVHPWMKAFCFVMEHPYFAVTGADGKFSLDTSGLADGEYGVKAWHEVLGEKQGKVTIADGKATYDLAFEG